MILRYFNNFIKFFIKMDGLTLKHIIERNGRKLADVAVALGITPQALNSAFKSADIKSGTLEKVAEILGVPICQLYGESCVNNQTNGTGKGRLFPPKMPVKRLSLPVWVSYKVNGNKRTTATKTALNKNPRQKTGERRGMV